ncbi:hypothetical protein ABZ070_35310 [Streptomyces sp. NPDC006283]|uniref:hypothetical protein n=1 Tax=Streptomyces sp. NPDC006283 TaxID=3156741 RepID=UPI0033BB4A95
MPSRQEFFQYFQLAGARLLLAPVRGGIPADPERWKPALAAQIRGLWTSSQENGRHLHEIAAELRSAADLFEASGSATPAHALKNIPRAIPVGRTPAVLREIAAHVDEWNSSPKGDVAMTTKELSLRFPRLIPILSIYFGQDGSAISDEMSGSTIEDGIQMWIDQVHPRCPWVLPGVAGECYEALALFHDEDTLDRFFAQEHGGGSGEPDFVEMLPLLAQTCIDHMKAHHPPVWERR